MVYIETLSDKKTDTRRTLISTGLSSKSVLRFATGTVNKQYRWQRTVLTLSKFVEFYGSTANVLADGGRHARKLAFAGLSRRIVADETLARLG